MRPDAIMLAMLAEAMPAAGAPAAHAMERLLREVGATDEHGVIQNAALARKMVSELSAIATAYGLMLQMDADGRARAGMTGETAPPT